MAEFIRNPEGFEQENQLISSSLRRGYFLTKPLAEENVVLSFTVEPSQSLELTLVDLADADLSFEIDVDLKAGASAKISVASLDLSSHNKKYRVNINHLEPDTFSRTSMAGINAGSGSLELLGNSLIRNGAHRSDTRQEGKITNLSPLAKSNVSPALLIQENDVKASHGAALGAYNPDELYYLMSRGLSLDESKKLITFGSLLPIIETLQDEAALEEAKQALEALTL